jgi:putative ABC transport system ATP-binding protein
MTALVAESVTKTYTSGKVETRVLQGMSLSLAERELTLVLGPSGSGKSTLLAILSGLLKPDSGSVSALGQDLWRKSRTDLEKFRLEHTGFVFQGFNLFPALTALEQVMLPLDYLGLPKHAVRNQALASVNGKNVIDALHRVARVYGATVVCVSHDARLAADSDRIITMQDGRILSDIVQNGSAPAPARETNTQSAGSRA